MTKAPLAAYPPLRLRRLRQAEWIRRLVRETVLHIAHKRTALPQTEALFIGAFEKLSSEYPTIMLNLLRVDTFSSSFPRRHKEFRFVAITNLFGDILSRIRLRTEPAASGSRHR